MMSNETNDLPDFPQERPVAPALERRLRERMAAYAARRGGETLLASSLEQFRATENVTSAQLAARLKMPETNLSRLALCRPPRDAHFAGDSDQIAAFVEADAAALLKMFRQMQVFGAFAAGASVSEAADAQGRRFPALGANSALVAPREREDDDAETENDENGAKGGGDDA